MIRITYVEIPRDRLTLYGWKQNGEWFLGPFGKESK